MLKKLLEILVLKLIEEDLSKDKVLNDRSKQWAIEDIQEIPELVEQGLCNIKIIKNQLFLEDDESWDLVFGLNNKISHIGAILFDILQLLEQYLSHYCKGSKATKINHSAVLGNECQSSLILFYCEVIESLEHLCSILNLDSFQSKFDESRRKICNIESALKDLAALLALEEVAEVHQACPFFRQAQIYLQTIFEDQEFIEDVISLVRIKCPLKCQAPIFSTTQK